MLMYAYLTYKVNSGLDMLIIKRTQIVLRKHDDLKMLFFWSDPGFFYAFVTKLTVQWT